MINTELEEELRRWNRPVTPMTAFFQSLRMEVTPPNPGGSQPDPSKDQQIVDHFEGIDLDELPDNVRQAVEKARGATTTLQTQYQTTEQRRVQAEEFARKQQSRADQAEGVLRKHNLTGTESSAPTKSTFYDTLIEKGFKPEAAKIYAESIGQELERVKTETRNEILQSLGPLALTVGNVQADQVLGAARIKHASAFAEPTVAKSVQDSVSALLQTGQLVNEQTVEHLVKMSIGEYAMEHGHAPGKDPKQSPAPGMTPVPTFKGNSPQGNHYTAPNPTNGAPVATQPETVSMMNAVTAHMRAGLPEKKGGK